MDFVSGPVEKTRIYKYYTFLGLPDAGFQIYRGAPFFVHDAHFQGMGGESHRFLHPAEQAGGEFHFLGSVKLGFDDVEAAAPAVAIPAEAF